MSDAPRQGWQPSWPALGLTLAIATTAGGAIWGLAQSSARNDATAAQLTSMRVDLGRGIDQIVQQIRDLPDLTARLNLLERQTRDNDTRSGAQQGAIDQLRQRMYEVSSDMDGLKRASAVSLPGQPGRRP